MQPIRHLALAALAALAAACGDEPVAIQVDISVDGDTCGPGPLDEYRLSCGATAGVWLRTAAGAELDQACVDLGSPDLPQNLRGLPGLFADLEVETGSGASLLVEAAVYAPRAAANSCLAPDDLDAAGEAILFSGDARVPDAGGSRIEVAVRLECPVTAERRDNETCRAACQAERDACEEGVPFSACIDARDACFESCQGDQCGDCEIEYQECVASTVYGACSGALDACEEACPAGDEACRDACRQAFPGCLADGCEEGRAACAGQCRSAGCLEHPI
jgi:hypothetical protein